MAAGDRTSADSPLHLVPVRVRSAYTEYTNSATRRALRSILFSLSVRLSIKVRRSSDHFFRYSLAGTCLESVNRVCAGNKSA